MSKKKALLVGDQPDAASAYGTQLALIAPEIKKLGYDVAIYAPRKTGFPGLFQDMTLVGNRDALHKLPFGEDMIDDHADHLNCDFVITMKDPYAMTPQVMKDLRHPWFPIVPIDGNPINELNKRVLRYCVRPIAVSKFGVRQLREIGLDPYYIPHAIDPEIFKPGDQIEARKAKGIPEDAFVALAIADNSTYPSRKNWEQLIPAWAAFIQTHPEAILMVHTCLNDDRDGLDLISMFRAYGVPRRNLFATDSYSYAMGISTKNIAEMYRCADVTICIGNEGFGMSTVESQACGIPVIGVDWAATPEMMHSGYMIKQEYGEAWLTPALTFYFRPFIRAVATALEAAYEHREASPAMAESLSAKMSEFHLGNVIPLWATALEDMVKIIDAEL